MYDDKTLNFELTKTIIGCCFDVMNELGSGFLEVVYKNSLLIALKEKGLSLDAEKRFDVVFRGQLVGLYIPDLIVEDSVIIELKCHETLKGEHQAQLINYLKVTGISVGILVNFGKTRVEVRRLHHPDYRISNIP